MKAYFKLLMLSVTLLVGIGPLTAISGVIFEDGFESGNLSKSSAVVSWGDSRKDTKVTSTNPLAGKYSLQFVYPAVPLGTDSFAEQRIKFSKTYQELWVKFDIFIPSNYYHRNDQPANNKFFAIYADPYESPGFNMNFSTEPASGGGSSVRIHAYRNGATLPLYEMPSGSMASFISSADLGKWHKIVMHFKVPTSSSSYDGIAELSKNGTPIISVNKLGNFGSQGRNYINEAYFLGWANSGFNQQTTFHIDNVAFSDTPFDGEGLVPPVAPDLTVE